MLDVHVFHDDMNTMAFIDGRKYQNSEHKKVTAHRLLSAVLLLQEKETEMNPCCCWCHLFWLLLHHIEIYGMFIVWGNANSTMQIKNNDPQITVLPYNWSGLPGTVIADRQVSLCDCRLHYAALSSLLFFYPAMYTSLQFILSERDLILML